MKTPRAVCLDASRITWRCASVSKRCEMQAPRSPHLSMRFWTRRALARLRAALLREDAPRAARRPLGWMAFRELAAGIVIGLLAAGATAWVALSSASHEDREDWRAAVVEYMDLYTNDTFAFDEIDPSIQAKKLKFIGDKVGTALTQDTVAVPGLRFKTAQMLSYDGAHWASSPMSTRKERRCCSASSPTEERMRRRARKGAATIR